MFVVIDVLKKFTPPSPNRSFYLRYMKIVYYLVLCSIVLDVFIGSLFSILKMIKQN